MPISFSWIEPEHILEYRLQTVMDEADAQQILNEESAHYDATPHTVHVLLNLTAVEKMPANPLSYARQSRLLSAQRGHLAILGVSPAVRLFAGVLAQLKQQRDFSFHGTREAALTRLHEAMARESKAGSTPPPTE